MYPLGHLALAYLLYVAVALLADRRLPARWALLPVAFGSQFPDLVDKPLAYYEVIVSGRSLTHSVFAFGLVTAGVWWSARRLAATWPATDWRDRLRRATPAAFATGYLSHLVGDALDALLAGQWPDARWLLWPLFPLTESPLDEIAPWIRMLRFYRDIETHPQFELIALAAVVFVALRVRSRLQVR